MKCFSSLLLFVSFTLPTSSTAHADIYQWKYINPADPSQGKRQSTMLAPDGAAVDVVPGADLTGRDLTMAYLAGANLVESNLSSRLNIFGRRSSVTPSYLTSADFSQANLRKTKFSGSVLTDADFAGADVRGASFEKIFYSVCVFSCSGYPFGTGITPAQLYSTASYREKDLTGIDFGSNDLSNGDFVGQNLSSANFTGADLHGADFRGATLTGVDITNASFIEADLSDAYFWGATLTDANFSNANVRGATFTRWGAFGTGVTPAQLYSTASYQSKNLSDVKLGGNYLAGANFAGQNLTNASFNGLFGVNADLTGTDFTSADTRGGELELEAIGTANNLIQPDGHIDGLDLGATGLLIVRDYDGNPSQSLAPIPVTVDQHLAMAPGGTLRMVFETDAWDSTISFAPGIPVTLGGTLELTFVDDVISASQRGRTFDLFDWTGVDPVGEFEVSSRYEWDLSNLYTTGEVTMLAVPEPIVIAHVTVSLLGLTFCRRRTTP